MAPELPTVSEFGFRGFEVVGWFGWLAPARTPTDIVGRLHREIVRSLLRPDVRERLLALSTIPVGNSPQQFGDFVRSERDKWARVVREAGIKVD